MRRLLAVLALGIGAALPATGSGGSIEDVIEREMPVSGVPGLAYSVVVGGDLSTVGGDGVVRAGTDEPVTPDTPFLTGSISKSFTALAVMQLVEAGQVDLDAEISQYINAFAGRPAGAVTIRELLSHTSGFSTLQGNASHRDNTGGRDELERTVDQLAEVSPASEPGQRWEYSNTNYQILGRLIEVVSRQEYQTYVTVNILEPVGMGHSFVADGRVHESRATGHRPWFWTKQPLPESATQRATAPQGGIVASATDLGRFLDVMMNGQDDVLSAAGKTLMMRPASDASPFYGLGWFVDTSNGTVWHTGSSPGFESLAVMVPRERNGAVVLVNGGSGVGFGETTELRWGIVSTALGLPYDGEGPRLFQKAVYLAVCLLPVVYLLSMAWAWRHRLDIRAKSGMFGLFSLWFPVLTTIVAAWVMLSLVPTLLGAPLGTIGLFQPDLGLALVAAAVTGVLWAVFRLAVAYGGRLSRS